MLRRWFPICCLLSAVACVGTLEETGQVAIQDRADAAPGVEPPACDEPVSASESGEHREGEACLQCHFEGRGAPPFTLGGTLYSDLAGSQIVSGATLHVIDADGNDIKMVSAQNGNFWSTQPVAYPATTYGSSCPETKKMVTPLGSDSGDCNKGGCHVAGFRVYLP